MDFKPGYTDIKNRKSFFYSETVKSRELYLSSRAWFLAFAIFVYHFVQSGTLGIFPEKWYLYYRSIRLSDLLLYALVIYSFINIKEYIELLSSMT